MTQVEATPLPFGKQVEMSEEEFCTYQLEEGGHCSLLGYEDSIFSFFDIVDREAPLEKEEVPVEMWPVKSRRYYVTRHKKSEVPPFNKTVQLSSSQLAALWVREDGTSARADLQESHFHCAFSSYTDEEFIYAVTRTQKE